MLYDPKELKAVREQNGITQDELALVLGWLPSAISRFESGRHDCNVSSLKAYQKGLDGILNSRFSKNSGIVLLDESQFRNTAYAAIMKECESLEHDKKYKGNGHHLAQRLVEMLFVKFSGKDDPGRMAWKNARSKIEKASCDQEQSLITT